MLHITDDLDTVRSEMVVISRKLQTRSCTVGNTYPARLNITRIIYDFQIKILDYL